MKRENRNERKIEFAGWSVPVRDGRGALLRLRRSDFPQGPIGRLLWTRYRQLATAEYLRRQATKALLAYNADPEKAQELARRSYLRGRKRRWEWRN